MADYSVKAKDIPAEQKDFTDLWELYKKYYHVQSSDNEEYWEAFLHDAHEYYQRHDSSIAHALINAIQKHFGERGAEIDRKAGKNIKIY